MAAAEALAPVRRPLEALAEVGAASAPTVEAQAVREAVREAESVAEASAEPAPPRDDKRDSVEGQTELLEADRAGVGFRPVEIPQLDVPAPPIAPVDGAGAPTAALAGEAVPLDDDVDYASGSVAHNLDESFAPLDDVEHVAARRERAAPGRLRRGWPLTMMQSAILALIVFDAVIVGWRVDFVRALPQTASFYAAIGLPVNLRGLAFEDLATATEQHDGVSILVVQGDIANPTSRTAEIPHLRFAVRNAAHQEIYSWTAAPSRTMLPPGDALAFHTRLASPPPDARDVLVRFVNRYDITAGAR